MSNRVLTSALLLALAAGGAFAQAQEEPPSRVGRVAVTQGQVSISGDTGEAAQAATVNWPVSSHDLVTTARGARTELRIGSTAIRLDGDSSLEVTELDDNTMRLRLFYGSASIRVANPEVLAGFELATPQGRVRMQEPGRIRVDAERTPDTVAVTVFEGVAMVEGGGASINLRAGKRAELRDDDVRTAQASRDAFDDWSAARDRVDERVTSTRYITTEMTGYEELDRYGSWRVDNEYGPVWIPTVASTWVPYRDGRWVWVNPWGWTWVDNAPWGYAPFHYGRWANLNNRWCWVPGRRDPHPAWAPALVGWVGGGGWSVNFNFSNRHQAMPATGWYPLSPRDHFVPHFRASDEWVRRANRDWREDRRNDHRDNDYRHRHRGLTVVPQDHFGKRGQVEVPRTPLAVVPPRALPPQAAATPPAPPPSARDWRRTERSDDRFERRADHQREWRQGVPAPVLSNQPQPVTAVTAPPQVRPPLMPNRPEPRQPVTVATPPPNGPQPQWHAPEPRQPVTVVTPTPMPQQQPIAQPRPREDREEQFEDRRGRWGRRLSTDMAEGRPQPQAQPPAQPPAGIAQPRFERPQPPAGIAQQRFERPQPQPQPAQVAPPPRPAPMQMPAAQPAPAPAPAAVAPPQRPSPSPRAEDRGRRGEDGPRQQER